MLVSIIYIMWKGIVTDELKSEFLAQHIVWTKYMNGSNFLRKQEEVMPIEIKDPIKAKKELEKLTTIFNKCDSDNDGRLNREEYHNCLKMSIPEQFPDVKNITNEEINVCYDSDNLLTDGEGITIQDHFTITKIMSAIQQDDVDKNIVRNKKKCSKV